MNKDNNWHAWLAGFFDGEGTVGIYSHGRGTKYLNLRCEIVQCHEIIINKISDYYNGQSYSVYKRSWKNINHRDSHRFSLNGLNCEKFLKDIYPYLEVKKQQVALAIEYLDFYKSKIPEGRKLPILDDKDREYIIDISKKLKLLKGV